LNLRASAFPAACCGVTSQIKNDGIPLGEDSSLLAAERFNFIAEKAPPRAGLNPESIGFTHIDMEGTIVGKITAPMAGRIIDVKANLGDTVNAGQEVIVLESMKMEMPINTTVSGIVQAVHCAPGDAVASGALLMEIE
jgi:biotin carboxyl carrier protein